MRAAVCVFPRTWKKPLARLLKYEPPLRQLTPTCTTHHTDNRGNPGELQPASRQLQISDITAPPTSTLFSARPYKRRKSTSSTPKQPSSSLATTWPLLLP